MSSDLKGKIAVVTGAASGIGAATARKFVAEGANVVLTDLQDAAGQDLARSLGEKALFCRVDVRSENDIAKAVAMAVEKFGALDIMINNAGVVGIAGSVVNLPAEGWKNTLDILLNGTFYGIKHAARVMIPQKRGVIISLSSTAGVMGGLGSHAYTAAKHAVIGLTKSAASELCAYGIRVNCVAPGNTVTAMTARAITGDPDGTDAAKEAIAKGSLLGIAGRAEDQAEAIAFLASDRARYINGHVLVADAGQTTSTPVNKINQGPATTI